MMVLNFLYSLIDKLGKKLNILIISPNYRSFGNCSEAIYFGLLHCIDRNKKMLIIKPFNKFFFKKVTIANKSLYELDHKLILKTSTFIRFFLSLIMTLLAGYGFLVIKLRKLFAKIFNLPSEFYSNNKDLALLAMQRFGMNDIWEISEDLAYSKKRWKHIESKYYPPNLPVSLKIKGKEFLNLNTPEVEGKKWVTFHTIPSSADIGRGVDLDSYYLAIEYLIDLDLHVFRIGDKTMPKCKNIPGLTDLAHIDHEDSIDLFLIQGAEFHFGIQSGPSFVAHLFNKEALYNTIY